MRVKRNHLRCGARKKSVDQTNYGDLSVLAPGLIFDDGMGRSVLSQLSMKKQKRILIVEDDLQARLGLQQLMETIGYDAEGAGGWLEALRLMREEVFDLAIVDIFLCQMGKSSTNGLDLIPLLRVFNPRVPVVSVTGQGDEQLRGIAL